jgi:paraquat-inducible protein A
LTEQLILCHDCDLPNIVGDIPEGGAARCPRCNGLLFRSIPNSIDRTIAFTVAGLVLFGVANAFPFLSLKMQGLVTETTLSSGVRALWEQDRPLVAGLVLFTAILAPFLQLTALIYVILPLRFGFRAPAVRPVFRLMDRVQTWSMMEVFLIGILVSLVKLADMAKIVPGIALWSFVALIPVVAGAVSSLDSHLVWEQIGKHR